MTRDILDEFEQQRRGPAYRVVSATPGLVVDGQLKAAGRLPSLDEVKGFLKQA